MAEVKLTIRTNLTKAAHEIENFGRVTKEEQTRINAFAAKFKGENIEKFIKKFERTAIAARAVGGELGDLKSRQVQLRAEIRRLIKSGMDPQDKALKSLVNAYQSAGRELETYNRQLKRTEIKNQIKEIERLGYAMKTTGAKSVDILKTRYSQLQTQIQQLIKQGFAPQSQELRKLMVLYQKTSRRIEESNRQLKNTEIKNQIKELDRLGFAMKSTGAKSIDIYKHKHRELQTQIQQLIKQGFEPQSQELREHMRLYQETGSKIAKYNHKLRKQQFLQNAVKNSVDKMGRAMSVMSGVATAGVVAGLGLAARQYAQFDDALVSASAKWGMAARRGTQTFEQLKQLSRQIGATTEFTATQAAKGLDYLAMAGFKTKTSMALLPKVVNLATAANIDLARASDIASDSLSAFGLMSKNAAQNAKNLERISDVMAKTAAMANTDLPTMFEAVKKGAAQFNAAGQSVETFSAMLGVLANSSVKGEEAGTQLRNMLLRLANPTAQAQKILKQLNITTSDSNGNFKDVIKIVKQFEKALKGMGNTQRTAMMGTVFGSRSITGMNILLQAGSKELEEYRKRLKAAGGAAKEMAEVMRSSLGNKIKTLQSSLSDLGWQILEALDSRLRGGLESLTKMIRNIDVAPVVASIKAMANIIGFLMKGIRVLIPIVSTMVGVFVGLKLAIVAATMAKVLFDAAFNPAKLAITMASTAGVIGVIGGLTAAFSGTSVKSNKLNNSLKEGQKNLKTYGKEAEKLKVPIAELPPKLKAIQESLASLNKTEIQSRMKQLKNTITTTKQALEAMAKSGAKGSVKYAQALSLVHNKQNELLMAEEALEQMRLNSIADKETKLTEFAKKRTALNLQAINAIKLLQKKEAWGLITNKELQKRSISAYKKAANEIIELSDKTGIYGDITTAVIQKNIAKVRELEAAMKVVATVPLQEKLAVLHNQAAQAQQKRLGTYNQFLEARMKQDKVFGSARLAWLQKEKTRIMALENLTHAERKAANIAFEDSILAVKHEKAKEAIRIATHYSSQAMGIFSGLSQIASNISQAEMAEEQLLAEGRMQRLDEQAENNIARLDAELEAKKITQEEYDRQKENYEKERDKKKAKIEAEMEKKRRQGQREAAIRSKFIQVAQASINTALAVTNALATTQPFIPNAVIAAATAAAAGAAQIGVAASTPIPAAETGGRFVVPPAPGRPSRADNIGLRVNEGEVIDVTPRGESAGRSITVQVNIDSEVLLKHVQEGFDSGRLVVNQNNIA